MEMMEEMIDGNGNGNGGGVIDGKDGGTLEHS